jgi:hypothetical protein
MCSKLRARNGRGCAKAGGPTQHHGRPYTGVHQDKGCLVSGRGCACAPLGNWGGAGEAPNYAWKEPGPAGSSCLQGTRASRFSLSPRNQGQQSVPVCLSACQRLGRHLVDDEGVRGGGHERGERLRGLHPAPRLPRQPDPREDGLRPRHRSSRQIIPAPPQLIAAAESLRRRSRPSCGGDAAGRSGGGRRVTRQAIGHPGPDVMARP